MQVKGKLKTTELTEQYGGRMEMTNIEIFLNGSRGSSNKSDYFSKQPVIPLQWKKNPKPNHKACPQNNNHLLL